MVVAVAMPLVENLADAYGTGLGLAGPFLGTAVGFSFLLVAPNRLAVYARVGIFGLGMTWAGPLQSRFIDQFPERKQATGFGIARTAFILVSSVGNVLTGSLTDAVGWPLAYGVVVGLLLLAAGLVVGQRLLEPQTDGRR